MTIVAITESTGPYPAYINVSEGPDVSVNVTVRTRAHNGAQSGTMNLQKDEAINVAMAILKHYGVGE